MADCAHPTIGRDAEYVRDRRRRPSAGAATAMLLARAGRRVLLVDRSTAGADTLSTHAVLRGGVMQLHRWGLLDAIRDADTPAISLTRFHYGDEIVDLADREQHGIDALYAPAVRSWIRSWLTPPSTPVPRLRSACRSSTSVAIRTAESSVSSRRTARHDEASPMERS